ncbi:hypothetical protein AX16_010154 [Volvariella volvacea WC 439]|nr:hypothetical protein AX16_010154 [Volvariella volvacea WC 439]
MDLEYMTEGDMDWDKFLPALAPKNLERLYLVGVLNSLEPANKSTTTTLPKLRVIRLEDDYIEDHLLFLDSVSWPSTTQTSIVSHCKTVDQLEVKNTFRPRGAGIENIRITMDLFTPILNDMQYSACGYSREDS